MTAITYPSRDAASRRAPVAWRRLAWVTWRQHRAALAGVVALLGVTAVYLARMGQKIHHAYAAYAACSPSSSAACHQLKQALDSYYGSQKGSVVGSGIDAQTVPFLLLALPVLLGVFIGAPVLARELETGTFRFAWTQGAGRLRWALATLVPLAIVLTAAAYGFSQLFSWYISPFVAEGKTSKFTMQLFGNLGVNFAAWTLLAFAMAAFAGVLIRRTVPAMAATLVCWTVLDVLTMMSLRQHYETPVSSSGATQPGGSGAWALSQWYQAPDGARVTPPAVFHASGNGGGGSAMAQTYNVETWAQQHHYAQWWSYQPATRFWPFQLIEGGWLLALSLSLLAATVWLARRRTA